MGFDRRRQIGEIVCLFMPGSLVAIILAAAVGLWPDPNPNPIGPGLLFFGSALLATVCLAVGVVWVWWDLRRAPA
jgi:hypothetical protein